MSGGAALRSSSAARDGVERLFSGSRRLAEEVEEDDGSRWAATALHAQAAGCSLELERLEVERTALGDDELAVEHDAARKPRLSGSMSPGSSG